MPLSFITLCQEEDGQDLAEYALLVAFMTVAAVALLNSYGNDLRPFLVGMSSGLGSASNAAIGGP